MGIISQKISKKELIKANPYFEKQAVGDYFWSMQDDSFKLITNCIAGSNPKEKYQQKIVFSSFITAKDSFFISSSMCSCPAGNAQGTCKHVAASLLFLQSLQRLKDSDRFLFECKLESKFALPDLQSQFKTKVKLPAPHVPSAAPRISPAKVVEIPKLHATSSSSRSVPSFIPIIKAPPVTKIPKPAILSHQNDNSTFDRFIENCQLRCHEQPFQPTETPQSKRQRTEINDDEDEIELCDSET